MIECPMCRHRNAETAKECQRCKAGLSLLVDYVSDLRVGLTKAEKMTREGELGEAVWAYLAVLEVDPDNATAKRQVGRVATAVRQFDDTAPGRRWARGIRKQGRLRRWLARWQEGDSGLLGWVVVLLLLFGTAGFAYYMGFNAGRANAEEAAPGQSAVR